MEVLRNGVTVEVALDIGKKKRSGCEDLDLILVLKLYSWRDPEHDFSPV